MEPWAIVLITVGSGLALFIIIFCIKQKKERKRKTMRSDNRTQIVLTPVNNQNQQPVQNSLPYQQPAFYGQNQAPPPQPPFYGQNYTPQQPQSYGILPNYMPHPGGQPQAPPSGGFFLAPPPAGNFTGPPYYTPPYTPQANFGSNNNSNGPNTTASAPPITPQP
jgi:hypothetical protein